MVRDVQRDRLPTDRSATGADTAVVTVAVAVSLVAPG
jgi:flagellin-like protein